MVTLFYNNCFESTNVANVETDDETKSLTDYNNERNANTTIPLNTNQNTFCSIIAENLEKDKDEETNDDYDEGISKEIKYQKRLTITIQTYVHALICGNSLLKYLEKCNFRFSAKTVFMITEQLIGRLKAFHDRSGLIHTNKSDKHYVWSART